jgi:phage-related protein
LKGLSCADKKTIGEDLKTVEFGWPLGMPVVRKMEKDLWEVRSELADKRTARILFTVYETFIVLLHGFIKKSKKTPPSDLKLAKERMKNFLKGEK